MTRMLLVSLLTLLVACSLPDRRGHEKKDFYTTAGGWDWKRLPLLEPYEITLIDPEVEQNPWLFEFKATSLLGTHHVKKVAVEDSIIYLRCGSITEFDRDTTNIGTRKSATAGLTPYESDNVVGSM